MNSKKIVITYGTFDLFHVGHLNILERAKKYGDYLIVAVSTDEFNEKKGKKSFFNFDDRKKIVESCRYVDEVIPETNWEQKETDVKKFNIDTFVMGDDWTGKFDDLKQFCNVVYLDRTPGISSSQVRLLSGGLITSTMLTELKSASHIISNVISKFEDLK